MLDLLPITWKRASYCNLPTKTTIIYCLSVKDLLVSSSDHRGFILIYLKLLSLENIGSHSYLTGFQQPHKFYLWKTVKPRHPFTFFTPSTHLHGIRCQVGSLRRPSSGCSASRIDSLSVKKKKKKCGQVRQGFYPNLIAKDLKDDNLLVPK